MRGGWLGADAAGAGALAACGADDGVRGVAGRRHRARLAAVEAGAGGPQQFFEANATPQLVNVFVATDDATTAVPYVYVDGELGPPGPEAPASGATFAAAAVTFDPDQVLDQVTADLPDTDLAVFSVVGGPDGAVGYGVVGRSAAGGTLDITLSPRVDVLAVDAG